MDATAVVPDVSMDRTHVDERGWTCEAGEGRRCHKCHKPDIVAVCADCGVYLCAKCRREIRPWYQRWHTGWLPAASHAREESTYCDVHLPRRISPAVLSFSALLLFSVAVTLAAGPTWLWLMAMNAAVVVAWTRHRIDYFVLSRTGGLPDQVAILPHYTVDVREHLPLDFHLGVPGQSYLHAGRGTLHLSTTLRSRAAEALRELPEATRRNSRAVRAGFVRLGRPSEAALQKPCELIGRDDGALSLTGMVRMPADLDDILRAGLRREMQFDWSVKAPADADRDWHPPFIVRPYAAASRNNSRCWGLEFVLCRDAISRIVLRSLIVEVPPELEAVERSDGGALFGPARVRWTNLVITPARPTRIMLEFAQPVYKCETISCTYEMEIPDASLAGLPLDHHDFWSATGRGVDASKVGIKRETRVDGRITVASRLQPTREEVSARRDVILSGRHLSDVEAHRVIAALAERGVETNDVVESRLDAGADARGQRHPRHWEILGRHYIEGQPYDIHIMLAADVLRAPNAASETNTSAAAVRIVVRTLAEWSVLQRQRQDVDAVCAELLLTITSALEASAS
jgi:hypothetical protein